MNVQDKVSFYNQPYPEPIILDFNNLPNGLVKMKDVKLFFTPRK